MNSSFKKDYQKALYAKLNNPEQKVLCPRCGEELIYKKIGNSVCEVKCPTKNCIALLQNSLNLPE